MIRTLLIIFVTMYEDNQSGEKAKEGVLKYSVKLRGFGFENV